MTKYSFLNELNELLSGLDTAERNEIMADYEEHFAFAKRSDKSDEDVIKSVGTPQEIAREILGDIGTGDGIHINVDDGSTVNVKGGRTTINGMDIGSFVENITSSVESLVDNITESVGERYEYPDEGLEGATESTTMITEIIDMTGVKNVVVNAKNQKIEITKTTEPTARIRLSRGILVAKVEDDTLRIEAREIKRKFVIGNFINIEMASKLEIELPEQVYELIKAKTANAKIEVAGFELSHLDLESSNGKLEGSQIKADDLKLVTFNGGIDLQSIHGKIHAQTTNGKIELQQVFGETTAHTTNGKIRLETINGEIDAYTTNGKIEFKNETIAHDVSLQTTNSKIEVNLAKKPKNVKFKLSTTHGKTWLFGNERNYDIFGAGEHEVTISTTNGKIEVIAEN